MFELGTTGFPVVDAQADFVRARRAHIAARAAGWLTARGRRPRVPRTLDEAALVNGTHYPIPFHLVPRRRGWKSSR